MVTIGGALQDLSNKVTDERSRWFLWSPVLFAGGTGTYFSLTWQPQFMHLVLTVLILGILLTSIIRNRPTLILLSLACFMVIAGFNAAHLRQMMVGAPVLQKKAVTVVHGTIADVSSGNKKIRLVLKDLSFDRAAMPMLSKVRLTLRGEKRSLKPGQEISIKAVLLPPPAPTYPGAYDFQRDFYFKEIGAVGYSISRATLHDDRSSSTFEFHELAARLRHFINGYIDMLAPPQTAGFSTAIMTGDKTGLGKQQLEDMRQSGLAHLLAISGLHMGMIGGIIFFVARLLGSFWPRIALHYPIKKWAAVIALIGLAGYLTVSGMSVSALRSYLMISMIFIAICFDRTAISLRNLALAALVILIFLPESLLTASFHMSFAAVFCLIAAYERYGHYLITSAQRSSLITRSAFYLLGILSTSLIASFATAPFAVFHFGQFALLGIPANLVAVPLMGLWVMPWTLVSFILMPFIETRIPLELASVGIDLILKTAHWVAEMPGATVRLAAFPTTFLVGMVLSIIWFLIWRNALRWGCVLIFIVSLPSLYYYSAPDILFAESGNLFMIRTAENKLLVPSKRSDRFARQRWEILFGQRQSAKISHDQAKTPDIRCDPLGCVYRREKHIVAISKNWMASDLDCTRATILLSADPINIDCTHPVHVIDKFDLWRSGTHALYFAESRPVRIETVNGLRGDRPWVPLRYRKSLNP